MIERFDSGGWAERLPDAVRAGETVVVAAQLPLDAGGELVARGEVGRQAELALDGVERALAAAGATFDDLVGVVSLHTDARAIDSVLEAARPRLGPSPPAWTPIVGAAGALPGADVAIAAIAQRGAAPKRCVTPDTIAWWRELPVAAGCRKGDLVAVSGQYGVDADGNVNTPGDHAGQARNALNRVREICALLDVGLGDVVDLLSLHQDPRGIDAVAALLADEVLPDVAADRRPPWLAAGVPAVYRFGMLGQYRAIASAGSLLAAVDGPVSPALAGTDAATQLRDACDALEAGLARIGATPASLVALESFHTDARDLPVVADALAERYGDDAPAWTPLCVTGLRELGPAHALRALVST